MLVCFRSLCGTRDFSSVQSKEIVTTGDQMAVVTTLLLHSVYFLVLIVTAAFLQTPVFSRLLLLLLIPLNACAEMKQQRSLSPSSMMAFILLTVLGVCCFASQQANLLFDNRS